MTQAELAEAAGIAKNTICNYEKGNTYPQDRNVYKTLANILGVDANYLHNEDDEFIQQAKEDFGSRGKKQAEELIQNAGALFAGGELSEEDKAKVLIALQEVFYDCKRENAIKYNPHKNKDKN